MKPRDDRATVAVAVCTYRRNELLTGLLGALLEAAARVTGRVAVGVVVVDDSADAAARAVAERFVDRFELGLTYLVSGGRNISRARNLAIAAASEMAEWTAMTDDDCQPCPGWIETLLDVQARTGAEVVTGPLVRRAAAGAPGWLGEEPFLELGLSLPDDEAEVETAATHNSVISSRWLKDHPTIRFEPSLGAIGGEDMVFFRSARRAGLRIRFSRAAVVYEDLPAERATLAYQLRAFFWHGNSSYVTSVDGGASPVRMLLHAANNIRRALTRPVALALRGRPPQLRYCLASILHSLGMSLGAVGVRVRHE